MIIEKELEVEVESTNRLSLKHQKQRDSMTLRCAIFAWSAIVWPVEFVRLMYGLATGSEVLAKIKERFGYATQTPTKGIIWIHAASVGETMVAITLIDRLSEKMPSKKFLLTTCTKSALNVIKNNRPDIIHSFLPIDNYFVMQRFLGLWEPAIYIGIEQELWPSLIYTTSLKCPLVLVNARMSECTYGKWRHCSFILRTMLTRFTNIITQSKEDQLKYFAISPSNTKYIGNLKYVAPQVNLSQSKVQQLSAAFEGRKVILAASTHPGDETGILKAFARLRKIAPEALLIIAPRHTERALHIARSMDALGLRYVMRTEFREDRLDAGVNVYVANTMGEMPLFYSVSAITVVCGSFVNKGHNIIEPARYNSMVVFGPDMRNFVQIANEFLNAQAAVQVQDFEQIYPTLLDLLNNDAKRQMIIQNAARVVQGKEAIAQQYCQLIQDLVA